MIDFIYPFNYEIDKDKILAEALDSSGYENFQDPLTGNLITGWLIKRVSTGYAQELTDYFSKLLDLKNARPRFYLQHPGYTIPFHKDRGTLCSINFLLSDGSDPIKFEIGECNYKIALLNTQQMHSVECNVKRILFKISIFDKSYSEVRHVLQNKLFC